jgi:uncharacterized delta-60 repeat protein
MVKIALHVFGLDEFMNQPGKRRGILKLPCVLRLWCRAPLATSRLSAGCVGAVQPDGTLDTSFGNGGIVQAAAVNSNITNLGIDAAGDIFVLSAHAEFSSAGQLDSGVTAAAITASCTGGDDTFLANGQSLIAGTVGLGRGTTDVQVHRFNANGSVDSTFTNPPFTYTGAQFAGHQSPGAIAVEPSGEIVVVGASFFGTSVFGAARLNSTGSLDSGFGTGGVLTTNFHPTWLN